MMYLFDFKLWFKKDFIHHFVQLMIKGNLQLRPANN